MRAASEHPRIATPVAAALIVLALASVLAGRALGGAQPIRTSDRKLRVADTQVAKLHQQLRTSQAQSAQLRGQLSTLTAQLARARQSQPCSATGSHALSRRPKR